MAATYVEACIFNYGSPKTLISDNGKQFAANFFQAVCSLLGLPNIFTYTYHPKSNGQVERYNRTILATLLNYVNKHQDDWERYATALTYAYNNHFHRSTGTTPFSLVFSRPPLGFSLHHSIRSRVRPTQYQRNDYVRRLNDLINQTRLNETPRNTSIVQTVLRQTDTNDTTKNQMRILRIPGPYERTVKMRKTTFATY